MPWGRAAALWPLRTGRGSSTLGWCGSLGRQTVFHQPDMHAAYFHPLWLSVRILIGVRALSVAESDEVHTVDGNVVFCYEVAINRFSKVLGALDPGAACQRRMRFQFEDVAVLTVDAGGQIVELLLGVSRQHGLAVAEGNFGFGDLVILIQTIHGAIQLVDMTGCALCCSTGLLGLSAGCGCRLVGR